MNKMTAVQISVSDIWLEHQTAEFNEGISSENLTTSGDMVLAGDFGTPKCLFQKGFS